MPFELRQETAGDASAIDALTTAAFKGAPHSTGTEAAIIAHLRDAGALVLSLVAIKAGRIVGQVAFSPVTIDPEQPDWYGLGPISVHPDQQGSGIGRALVEEGLRQLKASGAAGCVVLGDPTYYRRFGFVSDAALVYGDIPPEYFQRIVFFGSAPAGNVAYHPAFEAV
jgi:putative acetyltransferase